MESTVIVFSDVLLQLTRAGKPLEPGDADQIAALCQQGIALVVCSEQAAGEVKRIQTALGLSQPIICDGGETVIVPRDCVAPGDRSPQEERIIHCEPTGPCPETDGTTTPISRYQRGVDVIVKLFGRDSPVMTLGLTDPTKPDNLQPLVDHTIFVGADGGRGGLEVTDWVEAITDAAEQLRSARRRTPTPRPWLASPQPQFRPTADRIGSYRLSSGSARPS